jgi:hypothetical protein
MRLVVAYFDCGDVVVDGARRCYAVLLYTSNSSTTLAWIEHGKALGLQIVCELHRTARSLDGHCKPENGRSPS